MKLKLLLFFLLAFCFYSLQAQNSLIEKSDLLRFHPNQKSIQFIRFNQFVSSENKIQFLKKLLQTSDQENFELYQTEIDQLGFKHYKFLQIYKGLKVEDGVYFIHEKSGKIVSANGEYYPKIAINNEPIITKNQAFEAAKANIDAKKYIWEKDSFYHENQNLPQIELIVLPHQENYKLAYKIDVYAVEPLSRNYVYVDALNGKILQKRSRIHHIDSIGTAHTRYNGIQNITTNFTGSHFQLRESGRGNGIETFDLNLSVNHNHSTDFIDSNNVWNSIAYDDNAAYDAHWGTEKTYDYFLNEHSRNSIDDMGYKLKSYVHYDFGFTNAFWDGQRMTYGDGGSGYSPLTSLDIVAHEITHGLTEFTAGLIYQNESGALNESFSDIFGVVIDFYSNPNSANYLIGDQVSNTNTPFRSLQNPNAFNHPDTYLGNFWTTSPDDFGGVHTNSSVQNYWFYLLVNGESSINDNGDRYSVLGIGMDKAAAIAYRTLTVYLSPNSTYSDARFFAIQSAKDIYGNCSAEAISVTNAWHAVGIGNRFQNAVIADFELNKNYTCLLTDSILFINKSLNATNYLWDFGDGTTSNLSNPSHIYSNPGTYSIQLIANGTANCGNTDTIVKNQILIISANGQTKAPICQPGTAFPDSSFGIFNVIFENISNQSLGSFDQYQDYSCGHAANLVEGKAYPISIVTGKNAPENVRVWIDLNNNGIFTNDRELILKSDDKLRIHQDTVFIPKTDSTNIPLRMRVASDVNINQIPSACIASNKGQIEDYSLIIARNTSSPIANFKADKLVISTEEEITFQDRSINAPTSWKWRFLGAINNSSTDQNPKIQYAEEGFFDVELIVSNAFGRDTILKKNYIKVVNTFNLCGSTTFTRAKKGVLYDSGGPTGNHSVRENCFFNIIPHCANSIKIKIIHLDLECFADKLKIFDASVFPNLLLWESNCLSNSPDSIVVNSSSVRIEFNSSASINQTGFELIWESDVPSASSVNTDFGISQNPVPINFNVSFADSSTNAPFIWHWDFGDGNTSTIQNPIHHYKKSGVFPIQFVSDNCFDRDTIVKNIIVQAEPDFILKSTTLNANLNCEDSITKSLKICNKGSGDLFFRINQTALSHGNNLILDDFEDGNADDWIKTDISIQTNFIGIAAQGKKALELRNTYLNDPLIQYFSSDTIDYASLYIYNGSYGTNKKYNYFEIAGNNHKEIISMYIQNGNVVVEENTSNQILYPITNNIWYFIEFKNINFNKKTFDFYINNQLIQANFPFKDKLGQVSAVKLFSENSNFSAYYDQINIRGRNIGNIPNWINLNQNQAFLPAGDSIELQVEFNAKNLVSNFYRDTILFNTNESIKRNVKFPISLNVQGKSKIKLADSVLNFGNIQQLTIAEKYLKIENLGCQPLFISRFSKSNPDFSLSNIGARVISPKNKDSIRIQFSPNNIGLIQDTLFIFNNDVDTFILLKGIGQGIPTIAFQPDSLKLNFTKCPDTSQLDFKIFNTGNGNLNFDFAGFGNNKNIQLDSVLARLNRADTSISNLIQFPHFFTEGETGNHIMDGGNDMYDNGNYLNTNLGNHIPYSNFAINKSAFFGLNGKYFTKKYPGLFVMAADIDQLDYFEITGNLGADGSGLFQSNILHFNYNGINYSGYSKKVKGVGDPSINHLIIVENKPGITHSFSNNTDDDHHKIEGLKNSTRIYYLLYSENSNLQTNDQAIMAKFLEIVNKPIYSLNITPASGSVAVGDSVNISIQFNSFGINKGNYNGQLTLLSNDPINRIIGIPLELKLTGNPTMDFVTKIVDFDTIKQFSHKNYNFEIKNNGCDTLIIQDVFTKTNLFSLDKDSLIIHPYSCDFINITFQGNINGSFVDSIFIKSNLRNDTIILKGVATNEAFICVNPNRLNHFAITSTDSMSYPLKIYNKGIKDLIFEVSGGKNGNPIPDSSILIIQDSNAWGLDLLLFLQDSLGIVGATKIFSSDITITNFSNYNLIFTVGNQSQLYYDNLSNNVLKFEDFVRNGGKIQYQLGSSGANTNIVGGVQVVYGNANQRENSNTILLQDHPIFTALGTSVLGNPMNNCYLVNLPKNAHIITETSNANLPTSAEYDFGKGKVLVTGMLWEQAVGQNISAQVIQKNACNYSIQNKDYVASWLSWQNGKDTVAVGDSACVFVKFNSNKTSYPDNCSFNEQMNILSNAYNDSLISIPCNLFISDSSNAILSKDSVGFGNIAISNTDTQTVIIKNIGCDSIQLISNGLPFHFYTTFSKYKMGPNDSIIVTIIFSPNFSGNFSSFLNFSLTHLKVPFTSNHIIPVTGYGIEALDFHPQSFNVNLAACEDSICLPLKVYNRSPNVNLNGNITGIPKKIDTTFKNYYNRSMGSSLFFLRDLPLIIDSLTLEITVNGDFDEPLEFFIFTINNRFIHVPLQNLPNGTDITTTMVLKGFELSSITNSSILLICLRNTGWVDTLSGGQHFHQLRIKYDEKEWLTVQPDSFSLMPGDSTSLDVKFKRKDLSSELKLGRILIQNRSILCTLNIAQNPCSDFSYSSIGSCSSNLFFEDKSSNNPNYWHWDFGNGDTSNLQNPNYIYTNPGNYLVRLVTCNAFGCDTVFQSISISSFSAPRQANCLPISSFQCCAQGIFNVELDSIKNISGNNNFAYEDFSCLEKTSLKTGNSYVLSVETNDSIQENVKAWIDYNDNSIFETSEEIMISQKKLRFHSDQFIVPFSATTNKELRLRIGNSDTSQNISACELNKAFYEDYSVKIIPDSSSPVVNFKHFILDSCNGIVQFKDSSLRFPIRWHWDFGDGDTSNLQNPIHQYNAYGIYKVKLTVYNQFGFSMDSTFVNVQVLVPDMNINGILRANENINFSSTTPGVNNWNWDFGDGNTSTIQNPVHVYANRGNYDVKLILENSLNCKDSISKAIFIDSGIGINNLENDLKIEIFPNPNDGTFVIKIEGLKPEIQLEILNALGQKVYSEALNTEKNNFLIQMPIQTAGIYFVKLIAENKVYIKAINIIQK